MTKMSLYVKETFVNAPSETGRSSRYAESRVLAEFGDDPHRYASGRPEEESGEAWAGRKLGAFPGR
jgi:hypothetical protein